LDKLNLANPGQMLLLFAEADVAAGRTRADIEACARLAEMLGARSQRIAAYLAPPSAVRPKEDTAQPVVQPTVLAATVAVPTAAPASPTAAPAEAAAPSPTAPPPTSSPTPEPQAPRVVADSTVNLRGGPDKGYPVVARLGAGKEAAIVARNASGDWWQIEVTGVNQAWVAGTVVRVLGAIDTVAVAEDIPPMPTAAPRPTAAPQPTAAPPKAAVDYRIVETRLFTIQENGGCMGNHNFYVQVVDAAGAPVNGAVVKRIWANETVTTGQKDCYWNIGVTNEGCAHFDVYNAGDNLVVISDPVLGAVASETSRTISTKDADLTVEELMATGYCPEGRANCEWRKNPGGDLPPQLCNGHYSWFVKFQRTR
jgi:uncharacterized protein YgiM (DUF1202 family)